MEEYVLTGVGVGVEDEETPVNGVVADPTEDRALGVGDAMGPPLPSGDPWALPALVVHDLGQELAHFLRVGGRRGGVETTLGVLARHALFVLAAAIMRKRTTIIAGGVKLRPADDPEASNSRDV